MNRFEDISGRGLERPQLLVIGVVGAVVLTVIGVAFSMYSQGKFENLFEVNIESAQLGEGITAGADVKMNGLRIGHVTEVQTLGAENQRLRVAIDPKEADHIAENLNARFVSSNTLGMSSVELFHLEPPGKPLDAGATIRLPANSPTITVTSMIRKFTQTFDQIDTAAASRVAETMMFEGSADGIANMIRTAFELGQIKVGNEILVGLDPRPTIDTIDGLSAEALRLSTEALSGFRSMRSRIDYLVSHTEDVVSVAGFIAMLDGESGGAIYRQRSGINKWLDAIVSLATPLANGSAGLAGFYNRIPTLLDRLDQSFLRNPDGTVSFQLQVILAKMPYLAGDPMTIGSGTPAPASIPGLPGISLPGIQLPGIPLPQIAVPGLPIPGSTPR